MFFPVTTGRVCVCALSLLCSSWGNHDRSVGLLVAPVSDVTAFVLDFLSASMSTSHLLSLPVVTVCVCVCVCVHVVASSTFCSVFVLVQFDRRPPEPAVPWFLWSWCEHVTDRFVCVNVLVFPVAVLLVLTWPWCVCVRNWKKRIHRCYCNRGESDGDAVSLCINTFVKPLLKTDDCSRRAQWSSTKELECSSWSGAIVMMETQLKKMYFYTSSVSTMLQLFLSRSCCSFCGDQSPGILLHANRPVIHTSILLISNNILFRLTLVFAVCAFCYNVLAVCWFNWPTASRTK